MNSLTLLLANLPATHLSAFVSEYPLLHQYCSINPAGFTEPPIFGKSSQAFSDCMIVLSSLTIVRR